MNSSRYSNAKQRECIKVCIRVRPVLSHERAKDEVVYFPASNHLEAIKVADGQHLIESKYDKVYSQRSSQPEIYSFVKGKWCSLNLVSGSRCCYL